jgi:hypothetical protein
MDSKNKEFPMKLQYIPKYEQIVLQFTGHHRFGRGRYFIILHYSGAINKKQVGLFFANEEMNLLSTQFQLNNARKVFPW